MEQEQVEEFEVKVIDVVSHYSHFCRSPYCICENLEAEDFFKCGTHIKCLLKNLDDYLTWKRQMIKERFKTHPDFDFVFICPKCGRLGFVPWIIIDGSNGERLTIWFHCRYCEAKLFHKWGLE